MSTIEKPPDLKKKLVVTERLLMTAGITKMDPRIRAAMTLPLLAPNDPQFLRILKDIVEGIRYVFQTTNRYSFAINGSITLAFETAISNLLDSGDTILVVIHGVWSDRFAKSAKGMGFRILRLKLNAGELVETTSIRDALVTHKPKVLFLCHGDDSVGTLQPLRNIGPLCHENNCLLIVDASSTVVCTPIYSDKLEIDVLIASTEYCLGLPPGLSLISFSYRATDKIKKRKDKIKDSVCSTMNFDLLIQSWNLTDESGNGFVSHFAPPVTLLYALRESLSLVVEEGLDNINTRHIRSSLNAQKEITKMGLKFLVSEEKNRLFSVLVILVPDKIKREAIIEFMHTYYSIEISEGISPIDKVWRIGIMGPNANRAPVKITTTVLRDAIEKAKQSSVPQSSLSSPSTISD